MMAKDLEYYKRVTLVASPMDLTLGFTCWSCWHAVFFKKHQGADYAVIWCGKCLTMKFQDDLCKYWNDPDPSFPSGVKMKME